jgi:hypothetical protein
MWEDFHTASLWAFRAGESSGLFESKSFYESDADLRSLGIDYGALAYCIRLRHEDRAEYESKARDFYAEIYPGMPYYGIMGVKADAESVLTIGVREERPFYYVCPYLTVDDPRFTFLAYTDISSGADWEINEPSLEEGEPILSSVLSVPQPGGVDNIKFVTMGQPGREDKFTSAMERFSFIAIAPKRMLSLLLSSSTHAASHDTTNSVYLFDTSPRDRTNGVNLLSLDSDFFYTRFVGGARRANKSTLSLEATHHDDGNWEDDDIEFLDEIEIEVLRSFDWKFFFEKDIIIADRAWTMIVTGDPDVDELQPDIGFVLIGASMIFVVSCVLVFGLKTSHDRRVKLEAI